MTSTHLWHAVQARDARADGTFVYAVESTGIYCRPSCPSRRPRRSGVTYFPAPADAERAGFRACR
ncbi:MAG: Ada metal-binding domain-containing protein, partial [Vicinamibacterales bacterium]